ncbi:hypothetical protein CsatB_022437 [Cannabis sativa]
MNKHCNQKIATLTKSLKYYIQKKFELLEQISDKIKKRRRLYPNTNPEENYNYQEKKIKNLHKDMFEASSPRS